MFVASIAHMLAFPVDAYQTSESSNWIWNIASAANVMDLHADVAEHYTHFHGKVRKALKRSNSSLGQTSERAGLLMDAEVNKQDISDSG